MKVRIHLHFTKSGLGLSFEKAEIEPTVGGMLRMALYFPGPYPYWRKQGGRRHQGDLPMKVIIEIAAISQKWNHSETLKVSLQQVLGTCLGMGEEITIDGLPIKEVQELVREGHFDSMIKEIDVEPIKET